MYGFHISDAGTLRRNYTDTAIEYEQTELNELTECDEFHLGFWPDLSDDQTYYKCEIDQIAIATRDCIRDYFRLKLESETAVLPSAEKAEIPGTKPCFSLSIMKCANGFKYSHKMKVCVPDIVYGSEFSLQTKNPWQLHISWFKLKFLQKAVRVLTIDGKILYQSI